MIRRAAHGSLVALALAVAAIGPAVAAVRQASFGVSAHVVGRLSLQIIDEPATITLLADDLALGYKEVNMHYRVHSTRGSRYLLNLAPRLGLTEWIRVDGLTAPITLGTTEVAVLQSATEGVSELRLRIRLRIRPGVAPGTYAMPMRLSVSTA